MRISTAGMYAQGLQSMLQRQSEMVRTHEQMTTGVLYSRAGEAPAAAATAQGLDHALAALDSYKTSAGHLDRRLNLQEHALTSANDRLGRARDLIVQANTPTLSADDRKTIAIELRHLRAEMISIGNTTDGSGRALFAGTRDGVVPFTDNGGTVTYAGNDGQNDLDVAPGLGLRDADPGSDLFLRVPTGDGIVRGRAEAANTGSGVLQSASVTDHGAWSGGDITVEFTAADQYRVLDAGGAEIATGTWKQGETINAGGVQLKINGAPAAGDSFGVGRAPQNDIFGTLQSLADALDAPGDSAADMARRTNALTAGLGDLSRAQEHMIAARASTGNRLSALDAAEESRSATKLSLEATLSGLRDVNYAEAASEFAMQLTALEAAQTVTLRIQGLSLFNKLG
ncbi:flagellar hook-associated protein FlgL [Lysobacter sp. A286]